MTYEELAGRLEGKTLTERVEILKTYTVLHKVWPREYYRQLLASHPYSAEWTEEELQEQARNLVAPTENRNMLHD